MSPLKTQLSETMKSSMKSGDKDTLSFARNLHAAIRKKEIDDKVDLDDQGVQKIVGSLIKQRQDAIEQFKAGSRPDLVAKEEAELKFLLGYMPAQMNEAQIKEAVAQAFAESGAKTPKEMGLVMKVLMPKVQGKADGKLVNQFVKEHFEQLSKI